MIKKVEKTKKENGLVELTKACSEILRVSEEYSYLWDDVKLMPGHGILIFEGAYQHETGYHLYLCKSSNNKIYFNGHQPFDYQGTKARKTAVEMLKFSRECDEQITPEKLREGFYTALREPLGKYLANRSLRKHYQEWKK